MASVNLVHRRFANDGRRNFSGEFGSVDKFQVVGALGDLISQDPSIALSCRKANGIPTGVFYGTNPFDDPYSALLLDVGLVILIINVLHVLLKPLHQPRIVSQILGGIIIGPSIIGHNKYFNEFLLCEDVSFLLRNIGLIGFMYFLFISGVKMDLTLVKKSGKKELFIGLISVSTPFVLNIFIALIQRKYMDKELAKLSSLGGINASLAITYFPVLYPILQELNLLSSEVGRMAVSTSIISDAIGLNASFAFEAGNQGEVDWKNAVWFLISLFIFLGLAVICIRKVMNWIVRNTPEGKPVDEFYVVAILLGVLAMGFLTDMLGMAIGNGPLWLGLLIPDGPPLGSTLVERSETVIMELLLPFSFALVGLQTDVYSMAMNGWSSLAPLFFITIAGYSIKFLSTLLATLYFQLPLRDSLAFTLIMSLRGQVDLILLLHWMDKKIITIPSFTMMVLLTTMMTAIATPLISLLYDPTKPFMVNKRRTIQHSAPGKELRIVLCIEDQESLSSLVNLIEMSNPTISSPFLIVALHLIELIGRAAPVLIDHKKQKTPSKYTASDTIHHALMLYEEARTDLIKVHPYTAVVPKRTMNQDICELALIKKANIIILPFSEGMVPSRLGIESSHVGLYSVNRSVLELAPCSVGILVDKRHLHNAIRVQLFWNSSQHVAVLFLGGADAREALAYADRLVGNVDIYLTVVRFLSLDSIGDDETEKKLDDGVVTWFWVKNESNKRVIYREVVVSNGAETIEAIQSMNENHYELLIVGRKRGINPILVEGLSDWDEHKELGAIGDYVASDDFIAAASVLVIQQQSIRGPCIYSSTHLRDCKINLT